METLLTRILSELKIPYTKSFSENLYKEHPYCYTLYGIRQMLSRYNLKTTAIKLQNKSEMANLDTPFLAEVYNDIVIVKRIAKGGKIVYDWYGQEMSSNAKDFEKESTGIIMQIYPDESSIEPDYKIHTQTENINKAEHVGMWILFLLLLAVLGLGNSGSAISIAFELTNMIGATISYLIIRKTLNYDSVLADKICQMSKSATCNDVLQSKAAKLFNRYGWGEIGLGYFAISSVLAFAVPWLTNVLSVYSVMGMLFPFWSLWYQKFNARHWCPLCLCALVVLITQGFIGCYSLSNRGIHIDMECIQSFTMVGAAYALAIMTICKVVDLLRSRNEAMQMKYKLAQIKYKPTIISTLLSKEKSFDCSENTSHIVFGNKDANYKLTIMSNPYCQPCAEMHKYLQRLLDAGCQIQYVFNYFSEELSDVNKLLIAAYFKYGMQKAWKVYSDWYAGGKVNQAKFFSKEIDANNTVVAEEFERHEKWREMTGFSATPTLLLNGKTLPSIYNVEDITFMVENGL